MKFYIQLRRKLLLYVSTKRILSKQTVMRINLTCILLLISLMQVAASSFAQRLTLSKKNITLEQLFREIKAQSGYDFLYEPTELKNATRISINVKNAQLKNVLDEAFSQQPLSYAIDQNTIVVRRKEKNYLDVIVDYFKKINITGKVTDEKGNPLPGATIRIKSTDRAVVTNAQGNFQLNDVEEGAVLIISYIGYRSKEIISKPGFMNVILDVSSSELASVVVVSTGYQNLPKERATGAFSQVNRTTLDNRPVSNLSSALQGMVAGMQGKENEDGSVNFLIRGNTSLFADSKPLIVVDGFPISSSDFSDINPNDVESVTVLKDAAAASIWGARSANGVIVITTKRAKGSNKLRVDVNAFTRISDRVDLNQVLTQASSADHIAYERKAYDSNWTFFPYTGSFYYDVLNPLTLAQELIYANKYGKIDAQTMNAGLDRLSKVDNRSQIQDLLMQKAVLNQYNLNLQTGTDHSKTYASIMYENDKGAYKKNGYDRFNLNFNNDFKLTNFLSFNFGANFQYKKQETSGATVEEIQNLSPYEVLLNPDGSYGANLNEYNRELLGKIPSGLFPYADWSYNLLQEVNGRNLSNENLSARVQAGLNLKLLKGLTFDSKFQYERSRVDYKDYYDESTFYVRELVNSMTEYNDDTKTVGLSYIPKGGILRPRAFSDYDPSKDISTSELESYLIRNQLNFEKNLTDKHSISIIAGMELSKYTRTTRANPYVYGYYPDKLQSTLPPYGYGSSLDPLSDFLGGIFSNTVPGGNTWFGWGRDKYVSFYSNASYTYNNKYTISGSVRSDASNFITDDPKLRWSPLWSVGAKWNMKNEKFMENVAPVDRLELRLTYGKNGNVEKSTSTKALLSVGAAPNINTGTIIANITSNGNPNLRWEKTTTTNLGIDFALFNNKVFGSIDLYNKIGEGIIGDIALPSYTGTNSQKFNNAGITNRGIELTLGANFNIPNTPVRYTTSLTYAYNYNRVTSLYNPGLYVVDYLDPAQFVEGHPVNSVYSLTYKGMEDGIPQVAGPNGASYSLNDSQLIYYTLGAYLNEKNYEGTATPPHTLGWVNNIEVGDFTLTAIFNGTFGGVYRNPTFNYSSATVGSNKTAVNRFVSDVLAGNPGIPGFAKQNETQLYFWDRYTPYLSSLVESSSYIECKELTLGYTLADRLAKAIQVGNIRVFAQTRNPGLIWKANSKGYHPDWLPGTNRPVQTYTFGVNLQF
ncbi:SusC/RagA family TonB-linked outer membrane protein [Pedobacter nyackensis]|uniref:SusC/RagA family TonB-linked outer membrane protein n=1 Tax=Pedobacter nyackensis TaxID=475255 RepID=UPI00292E22BF|nr:SusC/RagA family TonB-linked outer membrane protein [Pedobacter nyackensis]